MFGKIWLILVQVNVVKCRESCLISYASLRHPKRPKVTTPPPETLLQPSWTPDWNSVVKIFFGKIRMFENHHLSWNVVKIDRDAAGAVGPLQADSCASQHPDKSAMSFTGPSMVIMAVTHKRFSRKWQSRNKVTAIWSWESPIAG